MKHEWSEKKCIYSNEPEGRARFLRFCYACGLLELNAYSARTRRTSTLYGMTQKAPGETITHADDEPACLPSPLRRTKRERKAGLPWVQRDHTAELEQLSIILLERELPFEQYRDLSGAQREVHISHYIDGAKTNLYGPMPSTNCGKPLEEVTWATLDLVKQPTPRLWRDGDAVCVECIGKTRPRDRRT